VLTIHTYHVVVSSYCKLNSFEVLFYRKYDTVLVASDSVMLFCVVLLGCGLSYHKRCAYKIPKNCSNTRRNQFYRPLSSMETVGSRLSSVAPCSPPAPQVCCTVYCLVVVDNHQTGRKLKPTRCTVCPEKRDQNDVCNISYNTLAIVMKFGT